MVFAYSFQEKTEKEEMAELVFLVITLIEVSHPNGPRFEKSTGSGETPVTREFTLYLQRGG